MTNAPARPAAPRLVSARQWTGLLLATTALGAGMAEARMGPPVMVGDQTVWVAATEGGEGGEAGAVAGVDADTAYVVRLAIVEGHLLAAAALYRAGMVDDAIGLSYHPEAEMMDEVRETLAAHGQADFTPLMQAFSTAMEGGAADVMPELAAFQIAVAGAIGADAPDAAKRFAVSVAVLRAAAAEYAGSIEGGVVTDVLAYHEAQAFVDVARGMVVGIVGQERLVTRAVAAMDPAAEAFAMVDGAFAARDPAILLGVAARVELISSQVR
ncbi:hypothetical protein [Pseudorhodobacter ferrugineus]|uniref:hypothetical protein n=1 Tax=Pseudorhodobacter ferrugineus TaxID=77008 RepID=UPI0003B4EC23|nr:hypothetical protein [Pseudorhodobacter ferrugineus]